MACGVDTGKVDCWGLPGCIGPQASGVITGTCHCDMRSLMMNHPFEWVGLSFGDSLEMVGCFLVMQGE